MSAIVFLGGGHITASLIAGLRGASPKLRGRARIVVHDRNPQKLRSLARRFAIEAEPSLHHAVQHAGILIVAVRPQDVIPLLAGARQIPKRAMCVSLAAGVPLSALRRACRQTVAWARAMPSPASRNRRGLTALVFDRAFPSRARQRVKSLFGRVGPTVVIPEREFDAFTVVYSTSQGYHALAARVSAARRLGLSPRTAFLAAAHGMVEGVRALEENPGAASNLLAEAATPGGIAAEVIRVMRARGYDRLVERAYRAGLARARRMARYS
ncbi:MAG TPA: NAD(P)-binding domain-containing protein [Candidatus Acidoferrales bacterium]|nr:NAD(P)-binding domain-containing protein [Candidatus Acidoferrales bacterium]